jgi:hypothetical protein
VKGPLQQMVEDLSTYYEASYVPPQQEYDGKFRTIDVKPLRVGLKVQAKTGYFSLPPGSATGIRPFEASLLKRLAETATALGLQVQRIHPALWQHAGRQHECAGSGSAVLRARCQGGHAHQSLLGAGGDCCADQRQRRHNHRTLRGRHCAARRPGVDGSRQEPGGDAATAFHGDSRQVCSGSCREG